MRKRPSKGPRRGKSPVPRAVRAPHAIHPAARVLRRSLRARPSNPCSRAEAIAGARRPMSGDPSIETGQSICAPAGPRRSAQLRRGHWVPDVVDLTVNGSRAAVVVEFRRVPEARLRCVRVGSRQGARSPQGARSEGKVRLWLARRGEVLASARRPGVREEAARFSCCEVLDPD